MSQLILIGEVAGDSTAGYGKSSVKYYSDGERWEMVLLSNGHKCGRLLFDSLDQMVAVQAELGKNFRVVPK